MLLKKIRIDGFRSVKDLEIDLEKVNDSNCFLFFGVNGTGKSNILKAISLLDKGSKFVYQDDCERSAKKNNEEVLITYEFEIKKTDKFDCVSCLTDIPEDLLRQIIIKKIDYYVEYDKESQRTDSYRLYFDEIKYNDYVYSKSAGKISKKIDKDTVVADYQVLNDEWLDFVIWDKMRTQVEALLPNVIFWKTAPEYLISQPIDLDAFAIDKTRSYPLQNLFSLVGFSGKSLDEILGKIKIDRELRMEVEDQLSKTASEHINELWPEHKVRLKFKFEGNKCEVFVEDLDNTVPKFNMGQRSDGFKHFISILLNLSARNLTKSLVNNVVLLDEPENSLHPSSVRYLMKELLSIGRNNYVFVASHSIYMVDKANLNRHYTVAKKDGKTFVEKIDPECPVKEEVIYEALGTSIFEIIEPNIIIFEGRIDSEIFDLFVNKLKYSLRFPSCKAIFAQGAPQIPKYIKFFDQKLVKGHVILDHDVEGRRVKKAIVDDHKSMGRYTKTLEDLKNIGKRNYTIEDLFPYECINVAANNLYGNFLMI